MSTQHTGIPARRQSFDATLADLARPPQPKRRDIHPRIVIHWSRIAVLFYVAFLFFLIGIGVGASLVMGAVKASVVPVCTDAIADAGGVCIGEPR